MRPLISYYGGKQRIASRITAIIATMPHQVYVEPFCGGAAVLFAKPRPSVNSDYRECLNDADERIVTLYRVAQEQPDALNHLLQHTPYSQSEYRRAAEILHNPGEHTDVRRAWAVVVQTRQSFSNGIGKGWGTSVYGRNHAATWATYQDALPGILHRLRGVYLSCEDALRCIARWDSPDTLFYCDPPYPGADQGHYAGYTTDDWQRLCDTLDAARGSWILSNYPCDTTPQTAHECHQVAAVMSAANSKTRDSVAAKRTECLWIRRPAEWATQQCMF
jgi:DNA adenine methylase